MLFSVTHPPDIPFVCKRNSVRGLMLLTQVHSAYSVDKDYGRQKTTKKIRQEENYGKILILKKKRKIQISEEMVVISFSEEQKGNSIFQEMVKMNFGWWFFWKLSFHNKPQGLRTLHDPVHR